MIHSVAGAEFIAETHAVVHTYADAALMTAFKYVMNVRKPGLFYHVLQSVSDRPTIVDSGVFTLQREVFGHNPPRLKPSDWFRKYTDLYVSLLSKSKYGGYVVECDCQGLTDNWEADLEYARGQLHSAFGDRVIHVWHAEQENQQVLRDNVKLFKRNSLSTVAYGQKNDRDGRKFMSLLRSMQVPKDGHVHLLGTSNFKYACLPDNYSMDASTWSMIARFGRSFPNSRYAVTWYRRKNLTAAPSTVEIAEAKFAQCLAFAKQSPLLKGGQINVDYLRALAYACVASQQLKDAEDRHYDHPRNTTITGTHKWPTAHAETRALAETTTASRARRSPASSSARSKPSLAKLKPN